MRRFSSDDRQPAAQLPIQRLYHPESKALDALVEVLQALLLDDQESPSSTVARATCFPVEHE